MRITFEFRHFLSEIRIPDIFCLLETLPHVVHAQGTTLRRQNLQFIFKSETNVLDYFGFVELHSNHNQSIYKSKKSICHHRIYRENYDLYNNESKKIRIFLI